MTPINTRIGLAICTPIPMIQGPAGPRLEPITVEWHRAKMALGTPTNCNFIELRVDGKPVDEARNTAVDLVLGHEPRPEFLFFLDYDVIAPYDAITKLFYRARCFPQYDIFAGVYCCKSSPPEPLVYKGNGGGGCWDWAVGDLLLDGITGIHMGLTLIRTSLLERMRAAESDEPLFYTTYEKTVDRSGGAKTIRGTEDLFFCKQAIEEFGAKILVDTSVLAGHIHHGTGQVYALPLDSPPVKRAHWVRAGKDAKEEETAEPLQKAIDLGAGATRRTWEGYRTYTTDLRSDVGADYVMDTRLLNFPDGEFDLVASCHHLEHVGRFDQETVWQEMVRILKPGGRMEHIVPNLEWAAGKIGEGQADEHVFNVLYGAQEAQGYAREFNTHLFGYTPAIARELAEEAGLVDVEIRSFREDPELGYNLVVTARKPDEQG